MERAHALTAMEKRRLVDLARTVPEALLEVGTTEKVFASIEVAREPLGEDKWGCDDADYRKSPSSRAGGGGHGVPLNASCGTLSCIRYVYPAPAPAPAPAPDLSAGFGFVDASLADLRYDDAGPAAYWAVHRYDVAASVPEYWDYLLGTALSMFLPEVYRDITHMLSLHGEAGHVLFFCATRLGIQSGGGQPDDDATWKRWRDLRASVVRHAHDALLRLKAAASAVEAAQDVVKWRSLEPPRRNGWLSVARQLVGDARRSLDEARDSVRLMRDAVVREYFESLTILSRAYLEC